MRCRRTIAAVQTVSMPTTMFSAPHKPAPRRAKSCLAHRGVNANGGSLEEVAGDFSTTVENIKELETPDWQDNPGSCNGGLSRIRKCVLVSAIVPENNVVTTTVNARHGRRYYDRTGTAGPGSADNRRNAKPHSVLLWVTGGEMHAALCPGRRNGRAGWVNRRATDGALTKFSSSQLSHRSFRCWIDEEAIHATRLLRKGTILTTDDRSSNVIAYCGRYRA